MDIDFELEDLEWFDDIEEWIDPSDPFYNPTSMSEVWDDYYSMADDLDDGWEFLDDKFTDPIESFSKGIKNKRVPDSAYTNARAVSRYSHSLSSEALETIYPLWNSSGFGELSSAQRARVIRYRLAPTITGSYDKVSGVSRVTMTGILKDKGLVFDAARPLIYPAVERLRNILSRSIGFDVDGEFYKSWPVLEGGGRNIVELANRQVILQTSELVRLETGKPLEGRRLNSHSDACDYCKSVINRDFPVSLGSDRKFMRFHDNCRCSIDIV